MENLDYLFEKYNSKYLLIPKGCTAYCQPLDKSINKPFKNHLRSEYNNYFIKNYNNHLTYEHLIDLINIIWYNESISDDMIMKSFIVKGIMNDIDGLRMNISNFQILYLII